MRNVASLFILCLLAVGCGSKSDVTIDDGKGNKVEVSKDGDSMKVTSDNGSKVDIQNDGKKINVTDEKGQKSSLEVSGDGKTGTIKANDGKSSSEFGVPVTEADLGAPIYPGSTEEVAGQMKAKTEEETACISTRSTPDVPDKVGEFYKAKLVDANVSQLSNELQKQSIISGKTADGRLIMVQASRGAKDSLTKITMSSTLKKKKS